MLTTSLGLTANGFGLAANALDRPGIVVVVSVPLQLGSFVFATLSIFLFEMSVWILPFSALMAVTVQVFLIPLLVGETCGFPAKQWLKDCLIPLLTIFVIAFALSGIPSIALGQSITRFVITAFIAFSSCCVLFWTMGTTGAERVVLRNLFEQHVSTKLFPVPKEQG